MANKLDYFLDTTTRPRSHGRPRRSHGDGLTGCTRDMRTDLTDAPNTLATNASTIYPSCDPPWPRACSCGTRVSRKKINFYPHDEMPAASNGFDPEF